MTLCDSPTVPQPTYGSQRTAFWRLTPLSITGFGYYVHVGRLVQQEFLLTVPSCLQPTSLNLVILCLFHSGLLWAPALEQCNCPQHSLVSCISLLQWSLVHLLVPNLMSQLLFLPKAWWVCISTFHIVLQMLQVPQGPKEWRMTEQDLLQTWISQKGQRGLLHSNQRTNQSRRPS